MGTYLQNFGLSLYILNTTKNPTLFASTLAISYIPRIILGPIAGVFADRFNKKNMMVILDFISGIIIGIFALLFYINGKLGIFEIYFIQLSLATLNTLFTPASMSLLPQIVKKEERKDANSIKSFLDTTAQLLSPILGGLIFVFGLFPLMIINSISFIISGISEIFIKVKANERKKEKLSFESFLSDLKEGIKILFKEKKILGLIFTAIVLNISISPLFSIGIPYILKNIIKVGDSLYGTIIALMITGLLLGPIIASKLLKKYSSEQLMKNIFLIVGGSLVVGGITFLPLVSLNIRYVVLFVVGWTISTVLQILGICLVTDFQEIVPKEYYGRIGSLFNTIGVGVVPIGQIIIGFLFDKIFIANVFFIVGVFLFFSSFLYRFLSSDIKFKEIIFNIKKKK